MPRKPCIPANPNPPPGARLLTEREVLDLVRVSRPTLSRWRAEGKFVKPIKLNDGGAIRFPAGEVEAWLASRPRA
jgi:predicted DNA-binding transcriptional regulator AlpA